MTNPPDAMEQRYNLKSGPYSSHSLMLRLLPVTSGSERVLDVGGGEGYLTRMMIERGYRVVCLAAPGSASAVPEGASLLERDLDFELPEFDEPFERIICGDVIEHVRDPVRLLEWLRGLLAPGGLLLASLPNSGHFYFRAQVACGRFPAQDRGLFDRTHLHFYTWTGWRELFGQCGFSIDSVEPTTIPLAFALGLPEEHVLVRWGEAANYHVARGWKRLLAYQFVVRAMPIE